MPQYDINIRVNAGDAEDKIKNLNSQASELDKTLRFLGAIAGAKQLEEMSDAYTVITNKLAVVTNGQFELNSVMSKTFEMAQQNRMSWDDLARSYSRIRQATEQLGLSQQETLTITDSITKLLKVGGATTQEAASVMLHLTHAFDEGKLHGRQLNLVMMESIPIQKAIAKELGITTGQLREAGKAGLITGDVLARAFLHANGEATQAFAKTLPTIKERFVQLKNAAEQWLGEANKGTGIAGAFGDAIGYATQHIDQLAETIMVVAIPAMVAMAAAWAATPLGAAALIVGGTVVAANALSDALSDATQEELKAGKAAFDASIDTKGYMQAQIDSTIAMEKYREEHQFFNRVMGEVKLTAFDLTEAWIQNAAALRRAQAAIAETGAKIQTAKIMAATGGEGFEGSVIRIEKTWHKINAETERNAAAWAQIKKDAQETDDEMRRMAAIKAASFAPSVSSLLTPIERDSMNFDNGDGINKFSQQEQARRAKDKEQLKSFAKSMRESGMKKTVLHEDANNDNFIDDAEGTKAAFRDIAEEARRSGDLTKQAWVDAFHASEDALAHFIRTGEFNFKQFTDGILDDLAKIIARQAILSAIGGVSGGGWTAAAGAAAIGAAGGAGGGFANGGSFRVGGNGGVDGNTVAFRASRNETVSVQRPGSGSTTTPAGAGGDGVTVINQFDPRDILGVLSTPHGQRVVNEAVRLSGGYKRVTR